MRGNSVRQRLLASTIAGVATFGLAAGGAVVVSGVLATSAVAQDLTQGTLRGTVQNQAGENLAGASVTVKSSAQGFTRTLTTGADGTFRASALPPGSYEVSVTAKGYDALTEQVRVGVGGTTDYFFTVGGGNVAAADEVVVVGARSAVSVFDATTTGLSVDVEELSERAPIARSATAVALLAPGVTESDSAFGSIPTIGGSSAGENTYFVNGLNITKFRDFTGSSVLPFEFYKNLETKTGGYQAEFGRGTGGVLNATTKSGTNQWQFEVTGWWQPQRLTEAAPNTYTAQNSLDRRASADFIVEAGGPIIKDRLFVYGLYNARDRLAYDLGVNGTSFKTTNQDPFYGGKIDFIPFEGHRIEATYWTDDVTDVTTKVDRDSTGKIIASGVSEFRSGGDNWIARYTGQWTDWLTTSVAYGKNQYDEVASSAGDKCPVITDISSGITRNLGCWQNTQPQKNFDEREVLRVDVDLFANFFGEHRIRVGLDNEKLSSIQTLDYSGAGGSYSRPGATAFGSGPYTNTSQVTGGLWYRYQTAFTASTIPTGRTDLIGQARRVRVRAYDNDGGWESEQNAYYIQDSWEVTDRLTLNLGVRNEGFQNSNIKGVPFIDLQNQWAPRIGATYDVFGDRSAKLFGFFGRYYLPVATNTNQRLAGAEFFISDTWNLDVTTGGPNDLNRDGKKDSDGTPILGTLVTPGTNADGTVRPTDTQVDADIDPMYVDEYVLGYEQRLGDVFGGRFEGWTAAVKGTYRELKTAIDDVAIDAAVLAYCKKNNITGCADVWTGFHQYVLTNPGENMRIVLGADELKQTSLGPNATARTVTLSAADLGYPKPDRTYKAVEFSLEKAFNGTWGGRFSYVWSENKGNYEGALKSDNGQTDPGLSQDFDQPGLTTGAYGYLPNHRAHTFKAFGSWAVTDNFLIGANVLIQSPRKFGCQGVHPETDPASDADFFASLYGAASWYCRVDVVGGTGIGSTGSRLTPRGSIFESDWNKRIDLTFSYDIGKALKLPGRGLTLRADVFNVFNSQAALDFNEFGEVGDASPGPGTADPNYRKVQTYQTPRYVRLGFNYKF